MAMGPRCCPGLVALDDDNGGAQILCATAIARFFVCILFFRMSCEVATMKDTVYPSLDYCIHFSIGHPVQWIILTRCISLQKATASPSFIVWMCVARGSMHCSNSSLHGRRHSLPASLTPPPGFKITQLTTMFLRVSLCGNSRSTLPVIVEGRPVD